VRVIFGILAALAIAGCAKAKQSGTGGLGPNVADAACGPMSPDCDSDGDGVPNSTDQCPDTPMGQPVNMVGCADSQLTPMLNPMFPPYQLSWSSGGDLGRAGGLTWTYTGIVRGDLFHIWWILCDDPTTPCGLSLDGPIDQPGESWTFGANGSSFAGGSLIATNTTNILLADGSSTPLMGRLTVTIVDGNNAPIPFATTATLGVTGRLGQYGAEITGTAYTVTAIAEVQDATSMTWTPYMDYYDAASTPTTGGGANVSFGGSFYDK